MRILLLLLLLPCAALADTVTLTWTAPTQREDATALPATEIAGYRVEWWKDGTAQTGFVVPGAVTTYVHSNLTAGRYCYTLQTVDTDGLESVATGQVCRKARPNPPTNPRAK